MAGRTTEEIGKSLAKIGTIEGVLFFNGRASTLH